MSSTKKKIECLCTLSRNVRPQRVLKDEGNIGITAWKRSWDPGISLLWSPTWVILA